MIIDYLWIKRIIAWRGRLGIAEPVGQSIGLKFSAAFIVNFDGVIDY